MTDAPALYCEDCAVAENLPATGSQCYAVCPICDIRRACFGTDPDPQPERKRKVPSWPETSPLR